MPYIKPHRRVQIDSQIDALVQALCTIDGFGTLKGDLNYSVTRLVLSTLKPATGWNYQSLSDAVGALQDAADEIKRRMLGPYEDECIKRNGDVKEFRP